MKIFHIGTSQKGLTLVELLVAMLAGVLLTVGVVNIFISAKRNYKLQENLSRLQENGRLAINLMSKDIRMAGYTNSACYTANPSVIPTAYQAFDLANAVNITTPANVTAWCITNSCVASTTTGTTPNTATATLGGVSTSVRTDVVRIYQWQSITCPPSDRANAGTLTGAGIPTLGISTIANGTPPANAFEFSYFLRSNVDNDTNTTGLSAVPALWKIDGSVSLTPQERVQNIENMVVSYGVDTDADYVPNYYVTADKMTGTSSTATSPWLSIVSISISLVVVTDDNGLTDTQQPYIFNGATITPTTVCSYNGVVISNATTCPNGSPAAAVVVPDYRLRRVFSTSIAVRNRLL
jgi:type IV pilus assembly protein PilW